MRQCCQLYHPAWLYNCASALASWLLAGCDNTQGCLAQVRLTPHQHCHHNITNLSQVVVADYHRYSILLSTQYSYQYSDKVSLRSEVAPLSSPED